MTTNTPKPVHVALFLPTLGSGGAERVTLNLAQGLLRAGGVQVDLVVGRAAGPHVDSVPPGVRLIDLKQKRMLFTVLPLARYLRAAKPAVLLSALNYANVAALVAAALSGAPIRVAVVNHDHLTSALTRLRPLKRSLLLWLMRRTYPHAHVVINVSEGGASDLATHVPVPTARRCVIGNPVVDQHLIEKSRQPVTHPWLASAARPTIVAVGSLIAVKDFAMLLHAMALLSRTSAARLLILGEGEQRGALQQLIGELGLCGVVDMPGFVGNPYAYISRATVLALSSRWEALPTVIIEAMACGTPIVATDCPCGPLELLEGGKYGRLVPVGDAAAMAGALLDAVQGKVAPAPAESWQRYGIENATCAYLKALGITVAGRPPACVALEVSGSLSPSLSPSPSQP